MATQVEDDSTEYFVSEHRAELTPQRRCCQPRRRIKGRNDFKTMVSPASSQVFTPSQKMFVGQYKYLIILCPKRPKHVKNLYPFSYQHLVTQSQKTERFHV